MKLFVQKCVRCILNLNGCIVYVTIRHSLLVNNCPALVSNSCRSHLLQLLDRSCSFACHDDVHSQDCLNVIAFRTCYLARYCGTYLHPQRLKETIRLVLCLDRKINVFLTENLKNQMEFSM